MEHREQRPQVPEQRTRKQLEENKGFGNIPEGEALPQKGDLGQVLSDGYRVKRKRDAKLGTIRKVMSDGRSNVGWDDKSDSVERPEDLTVIP